MPDMTTQLNYDGASQLMLDRIFAPVYFTKVAEYGFAPADQQEAEEMLALANSVSQTQGVAQNKQADARKDVLARARQRVNAELGIQSVGGATEQQIQQEALKLANDANIRDAALLYQDGINRLLAR